MPTQRVPDHLPTVCHILPWRAEQDHDRKAWTLVDGDLEPTDSLTFGQLHRRARAIAARLQALGARGQRVILLFPSSLGFVEAMFGCLLAGAIAVPVYPPVGARLAPALRVLSGIIRDADASILLTDRGLATRLRQLSVGTGVARTLARVPGARRLSSRLGDVADADLSALAALTWLTVEEVDDGDGDAFETVLPDLGDIAYLQYTSGSTGAPKGARILHSSVLGNYRAGTAFIDVGPEDVAFNWVPLYHDLGLVCGILQVPWVADHSIIMSPVDFLAKPMRWLEGVHRFRASITAGPNFALDLVVRKSSPEERARLDLSCLRYLGNGGEAVRADTLDRFADAMAGTGFRRDAFTPCFGAAEATLFITAGKPRRPPRRLRLDPAALREGRVIRSAASGAVELVSNGRADLEHALRIVEPDSGEVLPEGVVGEVLLAGESCCDGYWGAEGATSLWRKVEGRRFLRTGDQGFLHGGELYLTGRYKDLIIRLGRNYHPPDLERTAETAAPEVRPGCCAAFAVDDGEGERVVLAVELRGRRVAEASELAGRIASAVAREHGLVLDTVVLLARGAVPKTSSGKVRRSQTRADFLAGRLDAVAVVDGPETTAPADAAPTPGEGVPKALLVALQEVAREQLGRDVDPDVHLADLGLDSLAAAELASTLADRLGRPVSAEVVLDHPTLADLAVALDQEDVQVDVIDPIPPIGAVVGTSDERVTEGQRMFAEEALLLPRCWEDLAVLRVDGEVEPEALADALLGVVAGWPGWRTTLVGDQIAIRDVLDARMVEEVRQPAPLPDGVLEGDRDALLALLDVPMDLAIGSARWRLLRGDRGAVLLAWTHHIAYDARTWAGSERALHAALAEPSGLGPLVHPTAAHAERERAYLASVDASVDRAFWLREGEGRVGVPVPYDAPLVGLPLANLGPAAPLEGLARAHGCSLSALLLWAVGHAALDLLGADAAWVGFGVDLHPLYGEVVPAACAVNDVRIWLERGMPPRELYRRVLAAVSHARLPNREIRAACGGAHMQPEILIESYVGMPDAWSSGPAQDARTRLTRIDDWTLPVVRPYAVSGMIWVVHGQVQLYLRTRKDADRAMAVVEDVLARLPVP